ncbi:helix-turn-helix domain-containing protein [Psychrosphaera aestuarii]|uniref:helix-turn-helix domain-containing protein n=1 Tax=Psychrosphaera aestuarii TaxID=1266052 RepID=UPI001B34467A|nr:helix-turn-helix transcriptional regulator [Psychrosphaera aestuarii]
MLTINPDELSKREREVYSHIIQGKSQKEIADRLYICIRTVKFHCGNIYQKLKVKNKVDLIKQLNGLEANEIKQIRIAESGPKFR